MTMYFLDGADGQTERTMLIKERALKEAFELGKEERRRDKSKIAKFTNPYPRNSPEARKYYEGWCEMNAVYFNHNW